MFDLYWKMERLIAPNLQYSQSAYEDVLGAVIQKEIKWLDLGCGHQVLPPWRFEQERRLVDRAGTVVGLDADSPSIEKHRSIRLRLVGGISILPFRESTFDLVTANMVVEHLDNPELQFREVQRVLRPGGIFVFHTPNARGYPTVLARLLPEGLKKFLIRVLQARRGDDVFRTYYRANTEAEIYRLAGVAGFALPEIRLIASSAELAVIPPLALFELLWIRVLLTRTFRHWRTNLIVTLKKQEPSGEGPTSGPAFF